jgi:hypothetical protein
MAADDRRRFDVRACRRSWLPMCVAARPVASGGRLAARTRAGRRPDATAAGFAEPIRRQSRMTPQQSANASMRRESAARIATRRPAPRRPHQVEHRHDVNSTTPRIKRQPPRSAPPRGPRANLSRSQNQKNAAICRALRKWRDPDSNRGTVGRGRRASWPPWVDGATRHRAAGGTGAPSACGRWPRTAHQTECP